MYVLHSVVFSFVGELFSLVQCSHVYDQDLNMKRKSTNILVVAIIYPHKMGVFVTHWCTVPVVL